MWVLQSKHIPLQQQWILRSDLRSIPLCLTFQLSVLGLITQLPPQFRDHMQWWEWRAQHNIQLRVINIYILGVLLAPSISTWGDRLGYKFTKKLCFQGKSFGLSSRSFLIPGDNWQSCPWGQTSRDLAHSVIMRELFCKPEWLSFAMWLEWLRLVWARQSHRFFYESRSSGSKRPQSEKGSCVVGARSLYPWHCCFPILWPWVISNIWFGMGPRPLAPNVLITELYHKKAGWMLSSFLAEEGKWG